MAKEPPKTRHRDLVAAILKMNPSMEQSGFRRHVLGAISQQASREGADHELASLRRVVPDAFRVDTENRIITAVEVEDTSRLTWSKYNLYNDLWWALDCFSWWFELIIVDTFGIARHVDMDYESYHFIEKRHLTRGKRPYPKFLAEHFDVFRDVLASRKYL